MDCYVLKMNREWTQKAGQYLSLVEKMKSNTTLKSSRSGLQVKIVYPFIVADLIVSTGTTRLSLFHPADLAGPESEPSKIIIFSNLARLFFDRILKPVGLRVFGDTEGRSVRFDAYMSNLIMHKIAHFLGPFAVNAKSENLILVNSKLGDQFVCLEAIKADTVALSNTQVLIKAKLLSRKQEKRLLSTYVARLLDQSRGEAQSLSRLSALIQLHFFLNNQGIVFNVESDTLALNLEKLKENVKKLMTMVLNIQNSGSSSGAKQLIKQYSDIPEVLKRLVDKTADIPLSMDMEKKPDHP
jgi:hypothetical protein